MKIEITDEELEAYRKALELNPYIETGVYGGPNDTGSYSINFDVIDGEKASNFFQQLIYDKKLIEYLEEKAGFRVTSLNLFHATNISNVVSTIENCLLFGELKK